SIRLATSAPPRLAQHGHDRGRPAGLDGAQDLEAVPLIERYVPGVRRFEIGRRSVAITGCEPVLQQRRAMSLPLARRVDADQRQIPMRLLGMMTTHLLDDREHVRLDAL